MTSLVPTIKSKNWNCRRFIEKIGDVIRVGTLLWIKTILRWDSVSIVIIYTPSSTPKHYQHQAWITPGCRKHNKIVCLPPPSPQPHCKTEIRARAIIISHVMIFPVPWRVYISQYAYHPQPHCKTEIRTRAIISHVMIFPLCPEGHNHNIMILIPHKNLSRGHKGTTLIFGKPC